MYQYLFKIDSTQITAQYSPVGGNPSKIWQIPSRHGVLAEPIVGHTPMDVSSPTGVNGGAMTPWDSALKTGNVSQTVKGLMPIVFLRRMRLYNPLLRFWWEMTGGTLPDLNQGLMKFFRGELFGAYSIANQRGVIFGAHSPLQGNFTRYMGNEWIDINQFLPSNYTYNEPLCDLSHYDVLMVAFQAINLHFDTTLDTNVFDDVMNVCTTRIEFEINTNKLLTSST